jgi:hypothetical protein
VEEGAEVRDASSTIFEDAQPNKGVGGVKSFIEKKSGQSACTHGKRYDYFPAAPRI